MGIHFAAVGVTALASVSLVLAGCSSEASESTDASPAAPASPTIEASPTPTEPCVLEPDTVLSEVTYQQLQSYELNNGEPIPTFEEFLAFANDNKVGVLPEIKTFPPAEGQPKPPPTEGQFAEYTELAKSYSDIPEVLIGSFDESTLAYFADNEPEWPRIWFRGIGGTAGDAFAPPTVAEMKTRAPSADVLGLLNVLYVQGAFPEDGPQYDVPAEFAAADIPVYIWYNTATGGDTAEDGGDFAGTPSPGWQSIATKTPKNVDWIATGNSKGYAAWVDTASDDAKPLPAMVAHRGGSEGDVSENSMQAFEQAVANGAGVLETDIQWTKPTPSEPNGVPVLMHDATINRTAVCRS